MIAYVKSHIKLLGLLVAGLYAIFRPVLIDGQSWTLTAYVSAGLVAGGLVVAYLVKNTTSGIAYYAKTIWVVVFAGGSALVAVLPDGLSKADAGTITAALFAAVVSLVDGDTPRHSLGDHVETDYRGDVGDGELALILVLCEIAVCVAGVIALIVYIRNH